MQEDFTFSGVVLDPVIVPVFRVAQVLQSLGSIVVVGVLASLYPAYRATRIDVAEAMKFEA
jgi:ABC-type antimicrobial peptide transport system permease subunit